MTGHRTVYDGIRSSSLDCDWQSDEGLTSLQAVNEAGVHETLHGGENRVPVGAWFSEVVDDEDVDSEVECR